MPPANINYDRGVHIRTHEPTGMEVYMYQDTPGTYLNAHGTPVSDEIAGQAGYPVEVHSKQRVRRERMAEAMKAIEAELGLEGTREEVVETKGGFKIKHIGLKRYHVIDPDGGTLTPQPVPLDVAKNLLDQLLIDEQTKPPEEEPFQDDPDAPPVRP